MGLHPKIRSAWEDRFSTPTVELLVDSIQRQWSAAFDHARRRLLAIDGVREELAWHGLPWRWAMSYPCGEERPVAYLIPDPCRPRISVPICVAELADTCVGKLPRAIRDCLHHAPQVAGVRWCQWPLENKSGTEEILAFMLAHRPAPLAS